jgi:hypothetical protein
MFSSADYKEWLRAQAGTWRFSRRAIAPPYERRKKRKWG